MTFSLVISFVHFFFLAFSFIVQAFVTPPTPTFFFFFQKKGCRSMTRVHRPTNQKKNKTKTRIVSWRKHFRGGGKRRSADHPMTDDGEQVFFFFLLVPPVPTCACFFPSRFYWRKINKKKKRHGRKGWPGVTDRSRGIKSRSGPHVWWWLFSFQKPPQKRFFFYDFQLVQLEAKLFVCVSVCVCDEH